MSNDALKRGTAGGREALGTAMDLCRSTVDDLHAFIEGSRAECNWVRIGERALRVQREHEKENNLAVAFVVGDDFGMQCIFVRTDLWRTQH